MRFIQQKYVARTALAAGVVVLAFATLFFMRPELAPWVDTGTLLIHVRSVPSLTKDTHTLGVGFDELHLTGPHPHTLRLLTRRMQFSDNPDIFITLVETEVPVGVYDGVRFTLKSPELRNDWQTDVQPDTISLPHEEVHIPLTIRIEKDDHHTLIVGFETEHTFRGDSPTRTYLPVMQVEHRKGAHTLMEDERIAVTGGTLLHSGTYGMDWDGRVRYNYRAPATPPLPVEDTIVPNIDETIITPESIGEGEGEGEEIMATSTQEAFEESESSAGFESDTLIE